MCDSPARLFAAGPAVGHGAVVPPAGHRMDAASC